MILMESSHKRSLEVCVECVRSVYGCSYLHFSRQQKLNLLRNVEEFIFWSGNIEKLYLTKVEFIHQIQNFDLPINVKGFYELNRQFLAGVSCSFHCVGFCEIKKFSFQLIATCSTYIVIFMQLDLASSADKAAQSQCE